MYTFRIAFLLAIYAIFLYHPAQALSLHDSEPEIETPEDSEPAPSCEKQCILDSEDDRAQCVENFCGDEERAVQALHEASVECHEKNPEDPEACSEIDEARDEANSAYIDCITSDEIHKCYDAAEDKKNQCIATCGVDLSNE